MSEFALDVSGPRGTVLVAHPSAELYGSDRQMLESVAALRGAGWRVVVTLPEHGLLVPELDALGAEVVTIPVPVVRRSLLTPTGLGRFTVRVARYGSQMRYLRALRPDVVYVNTLTVPTWVTAARLARIPLLCHVHEAESQAGALLQKTLTAPLLLADVVVVNSRSAAAQLVGPNPRLKGRTTVVYNGVPGPKDPPPLPQRPHSPARLVLVGRLSPRKGTDIALRTTELLLRRGNEVHLELVGSTYPGYEWYEDQLRTDASREPLAGHVSFAGFQRNVWPYLEQADVCLVPSRVEPFGNVAVEAMLAGRPLVASAVQGLREIVRDGENGRLVPPDDPGALSQAILDHLADWEATRHLVAAARADAGARFSPTRYASDLVGTVTELAGSRPAGQDAGGSPAR